MTHAPPEATSTSSSQVKEREAAVQVRTEQHLPPEVRTRPGKKGFLSFLNRNLKKKCHFKTYVDKL